MDVNCVQGADLVRLDWVAIYIVDLLTLTMPGTRRRTNYRQAGHASAALHGYRRRSKTMSPSYLYKCVTEVWSLYAHSHHPLYCVSLVLLLRDLTAASSGADTSVALLSMIAASIEA